MAALDMASPRPMVSSIWFSGSAWSARPTTAAWSSAPHRNRAGATTTTDNRGSQPSRAKRIQARYMPIMTSSPWARLTTRITPKIRVRPMPTSA